MIAPQAGNKFAEVLRIVDVEVVAFAHIVWSVTDEDIIHPGQFRRDLVVASRIEQPPDEVAAQAEVAHPARRQVAFHREQLFDHLLQMWSLGHEPARNAALGRAVAEEDDLKFAVMRGPGGHGTRDEQRERAKHERNERAGFHAGAGGKSRTGKRRSTVVLPSLH